MAVYKDPDSRFNSVAKRGGSEMTTTAWARSVAIGCLETRSSEYLQLSSEMCWTAAFHVALLAGCITQAKYNQLKAATAIDAALSGGNRVSSAEAMRAVLGGYIIYFKHGEKPIHAMVSAGGGMACGNKNDCVGVGRAIGWEQVDLAGGLDWGGSADIRVPGQLSATPREVTVHAYPITDLANR